MGNEIKDAADKKGKYGPAGVQVVEQEIYYEEDKDAESEFAYEEGYDTASVMSDLSSPASSEAYSSSSVRKVVVRGPNLAAATQPILEASPITATAGVGHKQFLQSEIPIASASLDTRIGATILQVGNGRGTGSVPLGAQAGQQKTSVSQASPAQGRVPPKRAMSAQTGMAPLMTKPLTTSGSVVRKAVAGNAGRERPAVVGSQSASSVQTTSESKAPQVVASPAPPGGNTIPFGRSVVTTPAAGQTQPAVTSPVSPVVGREATRPAARPPSHAPGHPANRNELESVEALLKIGGKHAKIKNNLEYL